MVSPILIAIVGGSGAGKSWLADRLGKELSPIAATLSLDDFYRDRSHLPPGRRSLVNFDHPRAIDWPSLLRVLKDLRGGRATRLPVYDFATHSRKKETILFRPKQIILVEGLWLLRNPALRRLFRGKIFLECPATLRLRRRMDRDCQSRGRAASSVRSQFRQTVLPMHERFVAGQKRAADHIFSKAPTAADVRSLAGHFRTLIHPKSL